MAKGRGTVQLNFLFKGKWSEKLLKNVLEVSELLSHCLAMELLQIVAVKRIREEIA